MGSLDRISVGLDIGQINDATAVAICEINQVDRGRTRQRSGKQEPQLDTIFHLRALKRFPLGTKYPDVVAQMVELLAGRQYHDRVVTMWVDVTGVGRPVYDMLRLALSARSETQHVGVKPITFASGERYDKTTGRVGKEYLVSRLTVLMQEKAIPANPALTEMDALISELSTYRTTVSQDGHATFGATSGKHDDLVCALALAVLTDPFKSGGGVHIELIPDENEPLLIPTSHYGEWVEEAGKIGWW